MKASKTYIRELDYIRALSIIFVVLYHYTTRYQEATGHADVWPINFPWGCWAVNTLFVLTAYLTVRNFSKGGISFLYKRFARLWPAYVVCVVITSVFMFFLLPERLCSVKDILLNFTMFPTYLGAANVDGAYWTLPVEILFYFIIAAFMASKKQKHILICLNAWTLIMLAVSLCTNMGFEPILVKHIRVLLVTERGHCFVIGCTIALFEENNERKNLIAIIPMVMLCFTMAVINMGWAVALWTFVWSLFLLLISQRKLRFAFPEETIIGRVVAFVASISYPLYLIHQNVGFAIMKTMEENMMWGEWIIFIPIAISLLLATGIHYFVELPGAKILLGLQNRFSRSMNTL